MRLEIDTLRDPDGQTPDRYFVVGDGTWYWNREEAEQRLRTLMTQKHDEVRHEHETIH